MTNQIAVYDFFLLPYGNAVNRKFGPTLNPWPGQETKPYDTGPHSVVRARARRLDADGVGYVTALHDPYEEKQWKRSCRNEAGSRQRGVTLMPVEKPDNRLDAA
jgi:hypothetical protein